MRGLLAGCRAFWPEMKGFLGQKCIGFLPKMKGLSAENVGLCVHKGRIVKPIMKGRLARDEGPLGRMS